jgi:hypothetical protein
MTRRGRRPFSWGRVLLLRGMTIPFSHQPRPTSYPVRFRSSSFTTRAFWNKPIPEIPNTKRFATSGRFIFARGRRARRGLRGLGPGEPASRGRPDGGPRRRRVREQTHCGNLEAAESSGKRPVRIMRKNGRGLARTRSRATPEHPTGGLRQGTRAGAGPDHDRRTRLGSLCGIRDR